MNVRLGPRFDAIALVASSLLLAPTLAYRMGVDQGVFAYMGAELIEGRWPYLRTWESDFPGLIFLQAAQIFVLGKSLIMFRLFDLVFQVGNVCLIYLIVRQLSDRPASFVAAAAYALIYQGYGPWNTAQREGFGLLFILFAYWLYLTAERRRPVVTAAASGLAFGLALTIKPTLLALAAFYVPLLASVNRHSWTLFLSAFAGLIAPGVLIVVVYWFKGGLVHLYEACVAYQAIYTMRLRGSDPLLLYWLGKFRQLGRHAVALPVLVAPFLLWGRARRERFMLFLAYLGAVFAVFVQGTFAGYHYLPGLGVASILLGTTFSQVTSIIFRNSSVRGRLRVAPALLLACLLIAGALPFYLARQPLRNLFTLHFLDRPRPNEFRVGTLFDFTEDFDVAAYLKAHTRAADPIQIWGYESLIYYLADRVAASRFQTTHPLVLRVPGHDITPMQQRWRHEFMRDLIHHPPVYLVVATGDAWWWAPNQQTSEELLDHFPPLHEFIQRHYALDRRIGRFLLYRRLVVPRSPPPDTHERYTMSTASLQPATLASDL